MLEEHKAAVLRRRPKGTPKTGGRVKGTVNKVTREFRSIVQQLIDRNAGNVEAWLEKVAEEDPGRALSLLTNLAEFASPKLQRSEVTGVNVNINGLHIDALRAPQTAALVERMHAMQLQATDVSSRVVQPAAQQPEADNELDVAGG